MFSEIHQLKKIGLKKAQVARKLEIDVKTVSKYWEANPDEFAAMRQKGKNRSKKLKHYRDVILKWIRENPDITSGQILDWIKEHYSDFSVRERTLRRYVSELRQKHDLPKPELTRQYQAVADLPPGKQLQVDFGQKESAQQCRWLHHPLCHGGSAGVFTLQIRPMGGQVLDHRHVCSDAQELL
jgi:transposase